MGIPTMAAAQDVTQGARCPLHPGACHNRLVRLHRTFIPGGLRAADREGAVAMDLVVVRHAIAEERSAGLPDEERALTPRGRRRMRLAVDGLRRLKLRFDRVLHSPLKRAAQTAE